jgi:hypothetical protein
VKKVVKFFVEILSNFKSTTSDQLTFRSLTGLSQLVSGVHGRENQKPAATATVFFVVAEGNQQHKENSCREEHRCPLSTWLCIISLLLFLVGVHFFVVCLKKLEITDVVDNKNSVVGSLLNVIILIYNNTQKIENDFFLNNF